MTNRQAAVLASRIFCVWFIYNAVSNLAILPNFVGSLQQSSYLPASARFERSMLMNVFADLFRLGIDVAAAILFYRCDTWLLRFMTGSDIHAERTEADDPS